MGQSKYLISREQEGRESRESVWGCRGVYSSEVDIYR